MGGRRGVKLVKSRGEQWGWASILPELDLLSILSIFTPKKLVKKVSENMSEKLS